MNHEDEPVRLSLDASGSSSALRRALSAAKDDLPAPAHVEAMLTRFPFPMPGGGGPSGGGSPTGGPHGGPAPTPAPIGPSVAPTAVGAATAGTAAKILGGIALVTAIGGGAYVVSRSTPATAPSALSSATTQASSVATSSVLADTTASASAVADAATSTSTSTSTSAATVPRTSLVRASVAPSASASARPELDILKEAHAALRSNPSRALELVNEHASSYPKSPMAQEREMIRIEALLAQGKRAQAQALADAFKKAHPSSAYAQRLDALLGTPSPNK